MIPAKRLQIILLAALRLVLNTGYRMAYPFLPVFASSLGVPLSSISIVLSIRALVGALGPFLGSIADWRGRKTGMLLGVILFTIGCVLVIIWPAFFPFAAAMILITLGKAVFDPSMHAYVGDQIPYQQRATAVAIIETSWSLSFILGVPFMGYLIQRYGWSSPFTLLGLLGLGILLILQRMLPSDFDYREGGSPTKPAFWQNLRVVFTDAPALVGIALSLLTATANETINIIFGVWIEDTFGLQLAALGAASAVIGFSELTGEGLVGLLTDRLGKGRAIAFGLGLNCLSAFLLPVVWDTLLGALIGLFFFYLTFEFTLVSTIPLITEILPGSRATLLAAVIAAFSLGRAAGAALGLPLYHVSPWANSIAVLIFNLLALTALVRLNRIMQARESQA